MKQIKFSIIVLISLVLSGFAKAQTADEIIAKHIKAHGGEKKWEAVQSMELTGKFTTFSEEHNFFAWKSKEGAYYSDLNIGQHKVKEAFNGKDGWTIDPWHDFTYPRKLNKAELNVFFQKADLFTPFYKYKNKGYSVEYSGEKKVDGIDTYVLKLKRTNGMEETWYLNKTTYLEYKCESNWIDFAVQLPGETFFDDFRTIDGMVLPYSVERMFGQRDHTLKLDNIKFNTKIDNALFEMPMSIEIKKLEFLFGEWKVKAERILRNKTWRTVDETVSIINFQSTNLIQQKITIDDYYVQMMILNYSYNEINDKYRITIYNDFKSTMDIFEGNFSDGVFIADNTINCNDSETDNTALQFKISDITEKGFIMEINRSSDKGKTWSPNYKLTFFVK